MRTADLTTRAVAGFIDLLLIIGLTRLPDVIGVLSATGYILIRDGLFDQQSIGKKLIGLRVSSADDPARPVQFRESIIRNAPFAAAYVLWLVPVAGWVLGPLVVALEYLVALGDDRTMRVGDLLARTVTLMSGAEPASGAASEAVQDQGTPPTAQQEPPAS
ncbi:MAG: RDD family protein [Nitrospirota bacterium]|nr:RDD family protein [Nitrospirota bacterium]